MADVIKFSIEAVDKFSGTFAAVGKSMAKVGSAATAVGKTAIGAATAITGFTTVVANGIDKQAKFASRLGVSIEGLTTYQFVASQAGVSTEQFNMATQRMTRRVAEAAKGMGEAKGALSELGIDAKAFNNIPIEQKMEQLAVAFEGVQNPADRLRLGFKLFDSEGTAMLQVLGQGSEKMKEVARDAEFLGAVISEQAAANTEHFTDSTGRLTTALGGVSKAVAGEFMPVLSGMANRLANALATNRDNIAAFAKDAMKLFFTFGMVVKQIFERIAGYLTSIEGFAIFIKNVATFLTNVAAIFVGVGEAIVKGIWEGLKLAGELITDFGSWVGMALEGLMKGEDFPDLGEWMGQSLEKGMQTATENMTLLVDETVANLATLTEESASSLADLFGISTEGAAEQAETLIGRLSEFGKVSKDNVEGMAESVSEFTQNMGDQYKVFMDEMSNSSMTFAKSFFATMKSGINAISKGIARNIIEGGSLIKTFKSIAKQMLTEVIAGLVKMGIQRLVFMALNLASTKAEGASMMAVESARTFASAFASTAAIPIIGPALAPGVAAASTAAMMAGSAAVGLAGAAMGATIGGVAHGGMTNVPSESTYLLNKGERVLSPNQNKDFTDFISGGEFGGGGEGVTIESIEIVVLPNATNADGLLTMNQADWDDVVGGPIIDTLNRLKDRGVEPE